MGISAASRIALITAGLLCAIFVSWPDTQPGSARQVSAGCSSGRALALTFDDGPNPPYTQQVLSTLRSFGVQATFFDEGEEASRHPDVVRDEVAAGMAVGSHSWSHSQRLPGMSRVAFRADLRRASAALAPLIGHEPHLYRAPYGHTSAAMLRALARDGYANIGWDVDSRDWRADADAQSIVTAVLSGAHAGAIILMHDGGLGGGNPDRAQTVAALPMIIEGLRARGYRFVTVPGLTGMERPSGGDEPVCSPN